MYAEAQTLLHGWLSGFGWPVYREYSPQIQGAEYPYLVYSPQFGGFDEQLVQGVKLYSQSTSVSEVTGIVADILDTLPVVLRAEHGNLTIYGGSPLVQDIDAGDASVRGRYLNLIIETNFVK